jgi:hypothetical protein
MPLMRHHARAFLVATVAALVVDALLQLAMDAVRVSAYGGGAPWWVTTHLIERGRWVVLATMLWWAAPRLLGSVPDAAPVAGQTPDEAWRQVAAAVAVVPVCWVVATWIVSAVRFTLQGSWGYDGGIFLSGGYYASVLNSLAPWLLASAVLLAARRHLT